jgi:pyruvate/oxaloacetate carboxyltransferase
MAQYVGTTAVLNVLAGRYEVVPNEIRNYFLGYYGTPPGPVNEAVRAKVLHGEHPIEGRPGEVLEPMVDKFRAENGPFDTDEELVLAIFYSPPILQAWHMKDWKGYRNTPTNAASYLLDRVVKDRRVECLFYENKAKELRLDFQSVDQLSA